MAATNAHHNNSDPPIVVIDRRRQGFFTLDNELLDVYGPELGAYGLAVYLALARFANRDGECYPSQSTLAQRTGMSRMQVSRQISRLTELGLIATRQQFTETGKQRANLYILLDIAGVTDSDTPCNSQLHPGVTDSDTPCNSQLHKQHLMNNTYKEQDLTQQPESVDAANEDQDVVVVLTNQGISQKVAQKLVANYDQATILEKLDYLAYVQEEHPGTVERPAAWLRKAIEDDYAAPDGYLQPDERRERRVLSEKANRLAYLVSYGTDEGLDEALEEGQPR